MVMLQKPRNYIVTLPVFGLSATTGRVVPTTSRVTENVEAFKVEISESGDLIFFDVDMRMKRVWAKKSWLDFRQVYDTPSEQG